MTATKETTPWITAAEAAGLLNTTMLNVLMHIKRGLLAGEEREDGWRIDAASLAALLEKRRGGEIPAVCQSGCGKASGGCGSCG